MTNPATYSPDLVILLHEIALEFSGGLPGFAANKSLDGALQRIDHHILYEGLSDLFEIAAWFTIVIAQGHVFNDGNKRTAFCLADNFLQLNGYELNAPEPETVEVMVKVAEKKISHKVLTTWLKKYCKKISK